MLKKSAAAALLFCICACTGSFPPTSDAQAGILAWQLATRRTANAVSAQTSLPLRIFVTASTYTPGTTLTSVYQADNLCMTDPAYPGSGVFEALLGAPGRRTPASPAAWVIRPGRSYVDLSGNALQDADSTGLLPFPWRNPLTPGDAVWTGLSATWSVGNTCSSFSSATGTGDTGQTGGTSALTLNSASIACSSSARLICVEQPAAEGPPLKVFITAAAARPAVDFSNVAGADARCMTDSRYPGTGNYKAMIHAGGQRASSSNFFEGDFQIDWVFQSERRYVRASDGAHLQDSNRRRLLPLALRSSAGTGLIWTGISQFWTSGNNCSDWTSSAGAIFGSVGSASNLDRFFLSTGGNPCSNTMTQLLCVEQP